jgi:hypothetical protein
MTELAYSVSGVSSSPDAVAAAPAAPHGVRLGDRVGSVRVTACDANRLELSVAGDLGWGRAIVGLVPIVWCAAAWLICLRQQTLSERLYGCVALSVMAVVSGALMASSLAATWKFDVKRRRFGRSGGTGLFTPWRLARHSAGVRVETTPSSTLNDVRLRLIVVDGKGREQLELIAWNRREIDRAQVDALADAIRVAMKWE